MPSAGPIAHWTMFWITKVYAGVPAHWIMNGTSTVPELTWTWYALSDNHCGFSRRPHTAGPRKAYGSAILKAKKAPTAVTPNAVTPSKNWPTLGQPRRGQTSASPRTGSSSSALTFDAVARPTITPARSASSRLSRCHARWPNSNAAAAKHVANVSTAKKCASWMCSTVSDSSSAVRWAVLSPNTRLARSQARTIVVRSASVDSARPTPKTCW